MKHFTVKEMFQGIWDLSMDRKGIMYITGLLTYWYQIFLLPSCKRIKYNVKSWGEVFNAVCARHVLRALSCPWEQRGWKEREERRTKDCGMITRFQSLRVTPTPQPKMEEEEEGRIERGALHCWISRAAGSPFSMNIYSVVKRMLEALLDELSYRVIS